MFKDLDKALDFAHEIFLMSFNWFDLLEASLHQKQSRYNLGNYTQNGHHSFIRLISCYEDLTLVVPFWFFCNKICSFCTKTKIKLQIKKRR